MHPNLLTLSRLFTFPLLWFSLETRNSILAFVGIFWVMLSDFLDGYLARKFNLQSPLGQVLDPAIDKVWALLMMTLLSAKGLLPIPYFALVTLRQTGQILSYLNLQFILRTPCKIAPTILPRIGTFLLFLVVAETFAWELWAPCKLIWDVNCSSNIPLFLETHLLLQSTLLILSALFEMYLISYYSYQYFLVLLGVRHILR